MSDLPEPMTPLDCDLRDFPRMAIDVPRLMSSEFNALASRNPIAWMVGHKLWYRSWHQVPAASIPDDDDQLCHLAELGFDLKTFRKAKTIALRGWVKCSDGRLYHPHVAELALGSWIDKLLQRLSSGAGHAQRYHHEFDPEPLEAQLRVAAEHLMRRNPAAKAFDKLRRRRSRAPADDLPPAGDTLATGSATGGAKTAKSPAKREGERVTLPERAPSAQPPPSDLAKEAWDRGVALLTGQGRSRAASARTFIGQLLRDNRLEPGDLLPSIVRAEGLKTPDPQGYLRQAARAVAERKGKAVSQLVEPVRDWTLTRWRLAAENFAATGEWGETMGPPPGQPGCLVPSEALTGADVIPLQRRAVP